MLDRAINPPHDEFEAEFADVLNVDSYDDDEPAAGVEFTGDSDAVNRQQNFGFWPILLACSARFGQHFGVALLRARRSKPLR